MSSHDEAGICLVVTALLAFVNQLTLPVIVEAEEKAAAAARSEVLSAAKDFKRLTPEYLPEGVTEVYEGTGTTADSYQQIDTISGATISSTAYKKGVGLIFDAYRIVKEAGV